LAITIIDNEKDQLLSIFAYVLPSMSEEEREEIDCYITEVIADYPSPYQLDNRIIDTPSISKENIEGDIVFIRS
jgi:hypothetical protein